MKKKIIKAVPKDKWLWMPHAGHFIMGHACQFHLATKVGKYLVSTVGEYWPDSQIRRIHAQVHDPKWLADNADLKGDYWDHAYAKRFGFEEIGASRKYETMVFKIKKSGGCKACPYTAAGGQDLDFEGYTEPEDAFAGHYKMCAKWAKKS